MTSTAALRAGAGAVALLAACLLAGLVVGLGRGPSGAAILSTVLLLLMLVLVRFCCFLPGEASMTGRLDLFQPGAAMAIFYVVYLALPAWHQYANLDFVSNWTHRQVPPEPLVIATFAVALLGLAAFGAGYRAWPRSTPALPALTSVEPETLARRLGPVIALFLIVGALFKIAHVHAVGGVSGLFLNLSPTLREALEERFGGIPYFLSTLFDWGALLLLFRAFLLRRGRRLAVGVAIVAAALAFLLSGKRSAVLPFLLFPLVWYHYLRRPITIAQGAWLFAAGAALASTLLFARILGPRVFEGGLASVKGVTEVSASPVTFYLNSPELAIFDMTELVLQDRDRLQQAAGGAVGGAVKYNLLPILYVVPRSVWPDKPTFTDLGQVLYQSIIGGEQNVGFSVGILGGFYLFGGIVGLIVGMAAAGAAFRWAYERRRRLVHDPASVFAYAILFWLCFQYVRFGTLGFTILFFLQTQAVGLAVVWLLSRRWPEAGRPAAAAAR